MEKKEMLKRGSGILLHPISLPSKYPIGDLGENAYLFIDKLKEANFSYWQILPLNIVGYGYSPYMSKSAFSFNWILISPEKLMEYKLLDEIPLLEYKPKPWKINYEEAIKFKTHILNNAFKNFKKGITPHLEEEYKSFIKKFPHVQWDALFHYLSTQYGDEWLKWPKEYREPSKKLLNRYKHEEEFEKYIFSQFIFYKQWKELKEYANRNNIKIIGDIPLYVSYNSSDVWINKSIFDLNKKTLKPNKVAGVPPDYFSETGQLWGNPLYKWFNDKNELNKETIDWWIERFKVILELVDIVRIDHFRGFESYWAVKYGEKTAINGKWLKGPGKEFFDIIFKKLGQFPIIAEDLGIITEEVEKLRDELEFPGMKILQFAFNSPNNKYLPSNYTSPNCVVYTGTHDNNTTKGWFLEEASEFEKHFIWQYTKRVYNQENVTELLIDIAFSSIAKLAIIPMQDILNLDSYHRMNTPGTSGDNWNWKMELEGLYNFDIEKYKELNYVYNRKPKE